ncbi:MAG: histidinol-phosphate transaminase [Nocardioidaceae bacterium]
MATPRFRKALDTIPAYKAGRPPSAGLARSFKLSSNENPFPPLPGVVERATEAARTMNRYPDMGVSALHAAIAERYDVQVDQVASGAGSVAVFYHLLQALCSDGDEVVYAWRSFEAYPIAVRLAGATDVTVPLTANARHDLPAMLSAVTDRTKAVVICSPNNPTGPSVHRDELEDFLDAVPSGVLVAVDEAYREFVTDPETPDALELARGRDNVVVLRTFSKAYGLAGLRVGFGLGPKPVAEAIRKCALPFGISSVAQAAAVASLESEPALLDRVGALVAERARVRDALADQGWAVPEAQGNFVWLALGADSTAFADACEQAGVSVRPFDGDGVRVTIGEPEADDLFVGVAKAWRAEHDRG